MNVMLLCAGEGTRLRPYTLEKPKPLIPFLGVPLLCYSLSMLDTLSVDKLVVNLYHLPDQFKKFFKTEPITAKKLIFSEEKDGLLGSGGGIHKAYEYLQGHNDFLVMNADEVILPFQPFLLQEMISYHKWHKGIATLLTTYHPEVGKKFGGAWVNKENQVQLFSKINPNTNTSNTLQNSGSLEGQHFVGIMILNDKIKKYFKYGFLEENILYETLTEAMADKNEVYTYPVNANWYETGNPSDFLMATKECLKILKQSDSLYPKEYLKQTITKYSRRELMLEEQDTEISRQVQSLWNSPWEN